MIKEMPSQEKPREKALLYGLRSLSNRELLALILRNGIEGKSVLEVADELLQKNGGMAGIARATRQQLKSCKGVSDIKALEIMSCFEIARRSVLEPIYDTDVIANVDSLVYWLKLELGHNLQEEFMVVYLDAGLHVLNYRILFRGSLNMSAVFPREIFKEALLLNSSNIILVHNHPGGTIQPSEADRAVTNRLCEIAKLMDIHIVDHIIVSNHDYLSFAHSGLL
ncbi:MAG: DNA repair protein RadC [Solobacterium sp.]|nr:DNA repair protein RadC [Solobacterium sp.]